MTPVPYRVAGILLIFAAAGGLLFSFFGLVAVWQAKPRVTESLSNDLALFRETMSTTSQSLDVAESSLETSIASFLALQDTVEALTQTIEDTTPLLETLTGLAEEDMPEAVSTAQTALASAQESAEIIDSVLRALISLPFVSDNLYNPPVPLHEALGQVSDSMNNLPDAFNTMSDSLSSGLDNIDEVEANIELIATDLNRIQGSLEEAQDALQDYQAIVDEAQGRLDGISTSLPRWMNLAAWTLTFLLLWFAIAQVGLFLQGLEALRHKAE